MNDGSKVSWTPSTPSSTPATCWPSQIGMFGASSARDLLDLGERLLADRVVGRRLLLGEQLLDLRVAVVDVQEAGLRQEVADVVVGIRIVGEPAELEQRVLVGERGLRVLVPLGRLQRNTSKSPLSSSWRLISAYSSPEAVP